MDYQHSANDTERLYQMRKVIIVIEGELDPREDITALQEMLAANMSNVASDYFKLSVCEVREIPTAPERTVRADLANALTLPSRTEVV